MSDFPTSIHNPSVTAANKATVAGTLTNDGTFDHTQDHVDYGEEIVAVETKVGTGSSTPVVNSILSGTGAGVSSWNTDPQVISLTATGALSGASASITGTTTTSSISAADSIVLNSNYSLTESNDGNIEVRIGGAAGTVVELLVPTTGDIQEAINDAAGNATVTILPGTHTPASQINITSSSQIIRGSGVGNTIISASSFSVASQSIFKGADGIDNVTIAGIKFSLDTNSDKGIETDTTSGGANSWRLLNIEFVGIDTGKSGIYTDPTNGSFNWIIDNVVMSGAAGTGLNINAVSRSYFTNIKIDVAAGTHWGLDVSSNNNIGSFICDLAGTNSGTGNNITEVVF